MVVEVVACVGGAVGGHQSVVEAAQGVKTCGGDDEN